MTEITPASHVSPTSAVCSLPCAKARSWDLFIYLFLWLCLEACGILVPDQRLNVGPISESTQSYPLAHQGILGEF